jgi:hypothetical protein
MPQFLLFKLLNKTKTNTETEQPKGKLVRQYSELLKIFLLLDMIIMPPDNKILICYDEEGNYHILLKVLLSLLND